MAIGDLATWVAAIGTVGALFLALYQIDSGRKRRIAAEGTSPDERHQEHARLVSAWVGAGEKEADRTPLFLANGSVEPVYNVVATIVNVQGAAPRTGEDWGRPTSADPQQQRRFCLRDVGAFGSPDMDGINTSLAAFPPRSRSLIGTARIGFVVLTANLNKCRSLHSSISN